MTFLPIEPQRFAERIGAWLQADGPEADVVLSCRARLARNLEGFPFVLRLESQKAEELCARLREVLLSRRIDGETIWVEMDDASTLLRMLLRERHLISRDLAPAEEKRAPRPGRAVAFGLYETTSVMVNEEDHLRLQGFAAGFALREAFERVKELDQFLEREIDYACNERLGYLTGCPTNAGTGLRASVMLHLPGLALVKSELEKLFRAAQRTGLAVRGMYGEGSRAAGDFYQISNQVTLGRSEDELVGDLEAFLPCILDFERRVRAALLAEASAQVEDRVKRSWGMLRTARSVATEVALLHLSNVRLGVCLGLLPKIPLNVLGQLAVQIQKGHVQAKHSPGKEGAWVETTERDRARAAWLRRRLAEFERN